MELINETTASEHRVLDPNYLVAAGKLDQNLSKSGTYLCFLMDVLGPLPKINLLCIINFVY